MSKIQLVNRLAAQECGISNSEFRNVNNLSSLEFSKLQRGMEIVSGYNIQIDDTPAITVTALRRKARQMVRKGASVILVDYLQLMSGGPDSGRGNREQEISSISRGLKALSKELDIPVIALSQLSRAVETRGGTKRPQLSDLRESGALEQDADIVGFLYRPEYYGINEDENGQSLKGKGYLIIAKHRNGALDDVVMNFDGPTASFFDPDTTFSLSALAPALSSVMVEASAKKNDDDIPF
jgi:replicative DNA helicase